MVADFVVDSYLETDKDIVSDLKRNEFENEIDRNKCSHHFGYLAELPTDSSIPLKPYRTFCGGSSFWIC